MDPAKAADLVQKLRAKAASTTFPEEAKVLRAKADKLARKYRVDGLRDRQAVGDALRRQRPTVRYDGLEWMAWGTPQARPVRYARPQPQPRDPSTGVFDGEGSYGGS